MDYLIHSHISHILKANPNRLNVVYTFFPKEFKKDSVYHYSMKKRKKLLSTATQRDIDSNKIHQMCFIMINVIVIYNKIRISNFMAQSAIS